MCVSHWPSLLYLAGLVDLKIIGSLKPSRAVFWQGFCKMLTSCVSPTDW